MIKNKDVKDWIEYKIEGDDNLWLYLPDGSFLNLTVDFMGGLDLTYWAKEDYKMTKKTHSKTITNLTRKKDW